ncbi:hypothetical protein SAMN02745181_2104 [Rubritalea squalenifaciens DSM 18772]|uniref:Uncharacterized protein n=1 Tax=Rubritalea squalenifaciens DSM 18772 TaxID=1123071 RepID=A0A1M6JF48_9BACT|nr:hypothetical protein [Rubritalea squalenifaciens]SHJ45310.1 hypothetical protein SAMN02745181_2104 [Rubritalea squalenifaciens DSM 18772]
MACGGSNIAVTRQAHHILFIEAFAEHFSESREWICHFTKGKFTSSTYRTYKVIRTESEDPEQGSLFDIELKRDSTSTFHLPDHKLDKLPDELREDLLEILKIAGSK